METKIDVAQGKYTVVLSSDKPMYFLRYGELWSDPGETIRYGNMINSMAWELYDLREEVKKLKAL